MKQIIFFLLIPFVGFGQVADTVYLETVTDSTWRVVRQITFETGAVDIKKTEELDSATTVLFLVNQIHDNELPKARAIQNMLQTSKLDAIYTDINGALNTVSGKGFLPTIWPFVKEQFKGVWMIQNGVTTIYAAVTEGRNIVQITEASKDDENPTPEPGGFSGAFWGVTRHSFIPKNFLPVAIIPDGERFVVDPNNPKVYRALNSPVVFTKYR